MHAKHEISKTLWSVVNRRTIAHHHGIIGNADRPSCALNGWTDRNENSSTEPRPNRRNSVNLLSLQRTTAADCTWLSDRVCTSFALISGAGPLANHWAAAVLRHLWSAFVTTDYGPGCRWLCGATRPVRPRLYRMDEWTGQGEETLK